MDMRKIYLVDDDRIVNLVNRYVFEKAGFKGELKIFVNAREALGDIRHLTNEELPDLVFLDINMEPMNGWEFLDELSLLPQTGLQHCRVILLSSSIARDEIERSKRYKIVCDFVSKPLNVEHVQRSLEMFLYGNSTKG
jgi:CheY-like chemotaxis protein